MTDEEIAKLDPVTIRSVSAALRHAIDFIKGRGAMLRSLMRPTVAGKYCRKCDATTERLPGGRCAPCQRRHNREYARRRTTSWLNI